MSEIASALEQRTQQLRNLSHFSDTNPVRDEPQPVFEEIQDVVATGGHTYPDGSVYFGGWSEKGQKHGFGDLYLPDTTRYVGCFRNGLCSGLGVMFFPDGARYEGEFMEGWFHGHGVFLRGDGMKYEGEFRGGRLWGWGLVTFRDSTHGFPRQEGFFQDCRLVRNKKCGEVIERAQKVALLARAQSTGPSMTFRMG